MPVRNYQASFGGGELSPEFWGRIDDAKFQGGLATCRNFIIKPWGPAESRAGFLFVLEVKNSANPTFLIPFTYSTTQTMAIELGAGYFRFHTLGSTLLSGGVPYEVTNPYASTDLSSIHYVQSNDVLTLVHPNYAPMELRRLGPTSWTLTAITFGSTLASPSGVSATASASSSYQYVVTSVGNPAGSPPNPESLASSAVTASNNLNVSASYNTLSWSSVTGAFSYSVYRRQASGSGAYQYIGSTTSTTFNDNNGGVNTSHNPPNYTATGAPGVPSGLSATPVLGTSITYSYVITAVGSQSLDESLQSSAATCTNNLAASGTSNAIAWSAVTGASTYNVYSLSNGLYGYIGQAAGTTFTDNNITPNISQGPPMPLFTGFSAGDYPGAVSYFQQRRAFAGTINQPQNIWMSKAGTEANMDYSIPTKDNDALGFRVAARESNTIRHIVPLTNLLLLTSSAEWRVSSSTGDAITPTTISVAPQSYVGANNAQPVIINNNVLYAAARGGHMRELSYSWQANGFVTGDLSLRANHLFDNFDIVQLAYQKSPIPIVWMVSTSGQLIGLTYVPEQQIGAFHRHDTGGTYPATFESCCVVAEGGEDVLYVIVNRTINGQTRRYVECKHTRVFATPGDAFFVDCGMTYSGAPATTISGLSWLEGETVSILGDGAVMPQQQVAGGSITLPQAVSKAQIGLPIIADLQTLPVSAAIPGLAQGVTKNVNKVNLNVMNSGGIWIGPSMSNLTEYKQRTNEPYGSPPNLVANAEISVVITPSWATRGQVCVRQTNPLPLTVVSMVINLEISS